eukprot:SAG31_NODE_1405_length_8488_cov_2.786029_11_plen_96_part_00
MRCYENQNDTPNRSGDNVFVLVCRVNRETRLMRWLEHAAEHGIAGTDDCADARADYEAEPLADIAVAQLCLIVVGLRSLSHARTCAKVLASIAQV